MTGRSPTHPQPNPHRTRLIRERGSLTLHRFLTLTARVPDRDLRRAMAVALSFEVPRGPKDYGRYYRRVVSELDVPAALDVEPTSPETELVAG